MASAFPNPQYNARILNYHNFTASNSSKMSTSSSDHRKTSKSETETASSNGDKKPALVTLLQQTACGNTKRNEAYYNVKHAWTRSKDGRKKAK